MLPLFLKMKVAGGRDFVLISFANSGVGKTSPIDILLESRTKWNAYAIKGVYDAIYNRIFQFNLFNKSLI